MKALLFPGQGSQFVGMGKDLLEKDREAQELFQKADETLGFSLSKIIQEGPEETLTQTFHAQPALLLVALCYARALTREGWEPDFVAGHSLGEYTAITFAGGLDFTDALKTVYLRGKYMQEAVPEGKGAMQAVLGLSGEKVAQVCQGLSDEKIVCAANFNAPFQTVISGNAEKVREAAAKLKEAGAKRVIPLKVSAPFHSPLMKPAEEKLKKVLESLSFSDLTYPLVNNVDGEIVQKGEEVRRGLIRQVSSPVRWVQVIQKLHQEGVDTFVEVGPGKVLSRLVSQILPEAQVVSLPSLEAIDKIGGAL